jgi:histidinol-phosphate aminotransferase
MNALENCTLQSPVCDKGINNLVDALDCQSLDSNERQGPIASWVTQALSDFDPSCLQQYPDDSPLVRKLAQSFGLQPSQAAVFNGGDEAITNWLASIGPKSTILLPIPTFSVYQAVIPARNDLNVMSVPSNDALEQTIDGLVCEIESKQPDWLVLVNPNNPVGQYFEPEQIEALVCAAANNNCKVLLDEAYIEFAQTSFLASQTRTKKWIESFDNLVILRTFSKAFGLAGVRCGYLLGDAELIAQIRSLRMPYSVNQLAITMALAALEHGTLIECECRAVALRRDLLSQKLIELGLNVPPSRANFIAVECNPLQIKLLKKLSCRAGIRLRYFEICAERTLARITIPADIQPVLDCFQILCAPQLICLDMDGVLIDVSQSYDQAVIQTVDFFSQQAITIEQVIMKRNQTQCNDDWKLTQLLLEDLGYKIDIEQVVERFQAFYLGDSQNTQGLIKLEKTMITEATVTRLQARSSLAIVTSRPRAEALIGRSQCRLATTFTVAREDAAVKPSADGILLAAAQASAKSVWMVGDNVADIQAVVNAQTSGLKTVAIGISSTNQDALYQAGADIVLDNVNQLTYFL